ncbi:MFS transporter [Hamadaea sp. NPDC051192]|uniref:MFS transporter n=1 Tax=Hamadaea sp. NPDC051192 TaxID=3154940 RepID=UPI00342C2150
MTMTAATPHRGAATSDSPAARRAGLVLLLVCGAIFMLMLDATVVTAALSDIRHDFSAGIDGLQWVIDAYSIPLAGVLLTFATAADRFGRKRMFVAGMILFTASSLALTLADTIVQLDVLRAVQGVGAAMLFATALPLLAEAFPDQKARAKAIGAYGAVMAAATVAGPVLGGLLVTQFGWRSIFLINVPIGIAIAAVAAWRMPRSARALDRRTDWVGSFLLTAGLVAGVFGLTRGNALGWSSPRLIGLAVLAVVLLGAFLAWQFRAAHPLLDVSMLRKRGFTGTAVVSVAHMATLMAASNFLAVYLIGALGYTPLQMGVRLLPISLGALVAAPLAAILLRRVPIAVSLPATMALVALGLWLLGDVAPGDSWTHFVGGMVLGGLGLGAITAVTQAASLTFASTSNAGMASATFGTLRQVGMAVGVAGLGARFSQAAADSAAEGWQHLGSTAEPGLREQFAEAVGAGAGRQAAQGDPLLADLAHAASAAGLNAVSELGTWIAVAAVVLAAVAFGLRRRSA